MKRSELIISVLLALMFLTPISLKAQISFTVGDIQYWVTNVDEEVIVDKYVGSDDILTLSVPGTVTYNNQEFTVTSIGANAFSNCNSLKEINIPSSVTSIGYGAFSGCTNLAKVNIPEGVTSIEGYTFYNCTNLTNVNIPKGVTSIGGLAFMQSNLANVNIPESVTSIGNAAFFNCRNLTKVNIPEGVTSIEGYTFSSCYSLSEINIPSSVTSIGNRAFNGCTNLAKVNILEGVTSIGEESFLNCNSLNEITIPSSVTSIGKSAFSGCTNLAEVNISEGVTSIGDRAFEGCNNLSEIIIPSSVTSIGNRIFYSCSDLAKVHLPEGLTSIGDYAFSGCGRLHEITIPSSVTSIGERAFSYCNALREITIPEGVTSIEYEAFFYCIGLKTIILPNSITSIGEKAFYRCRGLHTITLPDKITNIGYEAFMDCFLLDTLITLSENPPTLDDEVFLPNSDMVVFVPKGCETTYQNAEGWKDFEIKIIIENPVTSITLNTEQLTMEYGTKEQLTATVAPDYADYPGLTWTSDNEEVATVDGSGLVTAVSEGEANITATAVDGSGVTATCKVTVTPKLVTSVTLDQSELAIERSFTAQLAATIAPEDADNRTVTWTSDNEEVATVDENGLVTAVGIGEANITAIAADGSGVTATCKVTVSPKLVTSVILDESELTIKKSFTTQLTATVAPDDAENLGLTWTSDNEEVATVDENGLVTAVGEGTATITATANDGSGVSASCVVTVTFIDGIADIETSKVTVLAANGRITVSGKEQDETVLVYDMGGRLLYQGESDVIDAPRKAMYIVTVSGKSYKVIVP